MGSGTCVLNISSSDDEDEDDVSLIKSSSLPQSLLSQKRHLVQMLSGEDDDVLVIEKPPCVEGRTREKRSAVMLPEKKSSLEETSDDDCHVLDGDPQKGLPKTDSHTNDADDLVVTGENGPVACRDFPHARHLCVQFPFKITSHDKFCGQCHCYVCDKLAPCLFWGQGRESSDHCHASDKEEKWKALRHINKSRQPSSQRFSSLLPQPINLPSPRRLLDHFRSVGQSRAERAVVSSSLGALSPSPAFRTLTPSSLSGSASGNFLTPPSLSGSASFNFPPQALDSSHIGMRNSSSSYAGSFSLSTSSLSQLASSEARVTPSSGGNASVPPTLGVGGQRLAAVNSAFTAASPTINGPGIYSQNCIPFASWCGSSSTTSGGSTRSQNCASVLPVSSADILRACTVRSTMQMNSPIQPDFWSLDLARPSQPSTNSLLSSDRLGSPGHGASVLSTSSSCRPFISNQPLTLRDYLYGLHREREQPYFHDFLQSVLSEVSWTRTANPSTQVSYSGQQSAEEQAPFPDQLDQILAQVSSQQLHEIVGFGAGFLTEESSQASRQGDSLPVLRSSNHANEAVITPIEFLPPQAFSLQNVQQTTGVSVLAAGSETFQQCEETASCSGPADVQNYQPNAGFEMLLTSSSSSQQPQQSRDIIEPQVPAGQYLDIPVSLFDVLSHLDTNDMWSGFDLETYEL